MNYDNELFELCKEVYTRFPEWDSKDLSHVYKRSLPDDPQLDYPIYDSDYLLEKLPASIASNEYPGKRSSLATRKDDDSLDEYPEGRVTYFAWYFVVGVVDVESDYGVSSDSLLKALLLIVIALDDAKVKL